MKPIAFRFDPEQVHDVFTTVGMTLGSNPITRLITRVLFYYRHPSLKQVIAGVEFENPIGLPAGFDKNALLTGIMPDVGFGFEEIGSVTAEPCEGNPKPRLWRIPEKKSIRVYYGLANRGAEAISKALEFMPQRIPIGVSIAKTNVPGTCDDDVAIADYVATYNAFKHIGDYDTINISCPNTFGGQPFTDPERLEALLSAIDATRGSKPVFLKLSPDLSQEELFAIGDVAKSHRVNGLICSNLTKKHDLGNGGLSGGAVKDLSFKQLVTLRERYGDKFVYVACGGIFSAEDAYRALEAGASLIQLISGMIFEGPQVISEINRGIVERMKERGLTHISQIRSYGA